MDFDDVKLEDEIQRIFSCVVLKEKLSKEAVDKAKQLMINKLKEVSSRAYQRSVYRDHSSHQLEAKDLLAVVQEEGDIYKFKIARTLMIGKTRSQASDAGGLLNMTKNMKPENYRVEDNQMSDD